jgi:hypothetical protein
MHDSIPGSKPGWGKNLLEALTRDQIETLLDVLADTGALLRLPEQLRAVDSDLAGHGTKARGSGRHQRYEPSG